MEQHRVFLEYPKMVYLWPDDLSKSPGQTAVIVYSPAEWEEKRLEGYKEKPHVQKWPQK